MTEQPNPHPATTTTLPPSTPLPDHVRYFLDDLKYATISTIDPNGTPRQAVVWYTVDGDEIVINSAIGRRWPSNLLRDPRMSLSVIDGNDGHRWVGMTGDVATITDHATTQADIAGMARRYHADEPDKLRSALARFAAQARISFRFRAASIYDHINS